MGRPIEWTPERIEETRSLMEEYTREHDIPIFAEFCYMNDLPRQYMYEIPDLSDTIKKMMLKKETQLERLALSGDAPTAMCIFSLKQLGWKDKQEIEQKITHEFEGMSDEELDREIERLKNI